MCEAYEYLKSSKNLTTKDLETLQKKTFYGKEKKSLAYIIGIMNMIFHGIDSPNIIHTNTLSENISDIQEKDRYNVVLFLDKGVSTKKIWYYQLNPGRNLGKTNPLNENDLAEFIELQKTKADSLNSWTVKVADINTETCDLSVKNPNKKDEAVLREPVEILDEISELDKQSAEILKSVRELL